MTSAWQAGQWKIPSGRCLIWGRSHSAQACVPKASGKGRISTSVLSIWEGCYNIKHFALGYLSPSEYEEARMGGGPVAQRQTVRGNGANPVHGTIFLEPSEAFMNNPG